MRRNKPDKSGVNDLRQAKRGQRIIYSLKAMPGRKIMGMFRHFYPYVWSTTPAVGFRDNSYELYNLDIYGMRKLVCINESDIYQVKFVDSFVFEDMDFDVGI